MANITKLEFEVLDLTGKNYMSWILNVEVHLVSMNLGDIIKERNEGSLQDRAKALIFLRHHLNDGLKAKYLIVKEPQELWKNLKERFDHQRTVVLPRARYEWVHLCLQYFRSISDYNSALFKISSMLTLCGEKITDQDMLEKTFSTFYASNMLLQQQYRERGFKKYSELISCLLVTEQNNELLMKNHQLRPTGLHHFLKQMELHSLKRMLTQFKIIKMNEDVAVDVAMAKEKTISNKNGKKYKTSHQQRNSNDEEANEKSSTKREYEEKCYRCGMEEHWSRTYRTAKHHVDLYQNSIKRKGQFETG